MKRLVSVSAVIGVAGLLFAAPALAFQCPKLISQINTEAASRLDSAGHEARGKAQAAAKLHAEGKHADAEKVAKEGLALLGKKM